MRKTAPQLALLVICVAPFVTSCLMPSAPRAPRQSLRASDASAPSAHAQNEPPITELPPTDDRLGPDRGNGRMTYRCTSEVGVDKVTRLLNVQSSDREVRSELDTRGQLMFESNAGMVAVVAGEARANFALGNPSIEFQRGATPAHDAVNVSCRRIIDSGREASKAIDPVRPSRTLRCRGVLKTRRQTTPIEVDLPGLGAADSRKRFIVAETHDWMVEVWSNSGQISIDVVNRLDAKTYFSSQLFGTNPFQAEQVGLQAALPGSDEAMLAASCRF